MQENFEKNLCAVHGKYMRQSKSDPDDVLEWMWSFLVLSGTAIYILERPPDTPPTKHEESLYRYLDNVTPLQSVTPPWNARHAYEWLIQAGELRLCLHENWEGQWESLEMAKLVDEYIAILKSWT